MDEIIQLLKEEFKNERELWNADKQRLQTALNETQEGLTSTKLLLKDNQVESERLKHQLNEISQKYAVAQGKLEIEEKRNSELQESKLATDKSFAELRKRSWK